MSAGRPTEYSDEMLPKIRHYIDNFSEYGDKAPSIVGLCRVLKRGRSTLYEWSKDSDKGGFSDMFAEIGEEQERVVVNGGLSGDMNSTIAKLMLAKHGYSDKQETQLTGKDGGPVEMTTFNFVPVGSKGSDD